MGVGTAKLVRLTGLTRPRDQVGAAGLAARAVVGGLFVGHGTQKLFGWFGGPGAQGTEQMMRSLDMSPPRGHAYTAGAVESLGGILVALGLATPVAASGLIGVMATAIRKVHLRNGPWASKGGYEYNLVLIALLTALTEAGPGTFSLDRLLGIERRGVRWAVAALGTGLVTSDLVMRLGGRHASRHAAYPAETATPAPLHTAEGAAEGAGE